MISAWYYFLDILVTGITHDKCITVASIHGLVMAIKYADAHYWFSGLSLYSFVRASYF